MQNSPSPLWMVLIGLLREVVRSELPPRAEGDEAAERGRCGAGKERAGNSLSPISNVAAGKVKF